MKRNTLSANRNLRRTRTIGSAGFTVMEVLASMAATSLLLAGMASTVYVSTRANDTTKGPVAGIIEGTRATQQIAADVQLAQTFSTRSATDVQFTVADRDGNLTPDTVRYFWSGTAGDPLKVQYNGGNAVALVSDVRDCQFTYTVQTVPKTTTTQTIANSGQTMLASWTSSNWPGFPGSGGGAGSITPKTLNLLTWCSECFHLNVPTGATNVQITKVRLWLAKVSLGGGSTTVGIYSAAGGTGPQPTGSAIGTTQTKANNTLTTSYVPYDFTFSDVPISNTSNAYNIYIKSTSSTGGSAFQNYSWASAPSDSSVLKFTTDAGSSWNAQADNQYDTPFEVWGTYDATSSTQTTTNRYFVRGVSIKLRVGNDSTSQVSTSSIVLNSPEVTSP